MIYTENDLRIWNLIKPDPIQRNLLQQKQKKRFGIIRICLLTVLFLSSCYSSREQEHPLVSIQIQDRNGLTETIGDPDRLEGFENLDFLSTQPYKKVLRVYKQKGKNSAKITTYFPNGTPWQYLEAQDMRAYGIYKEWHANGQLKIEAYVIGGPADITPSAQCDWLFDGNASVFDEQGHLIASIPYEKGVIEGKALYYHSNGNLQKELFYHSNELEGEAKEFTHDGSLCSKSHYVSGVKQGNSQGFWSEAQESWTEQYNNGNLQEGRYFLPNGQLVSEVHNGHGFRAIFEDTHLSELIEIRKGRQEGLVKRFTSSGELLSAYFIKQGKKHGEEIEYFLSHEKEDLSDALVPKISIPWIDDTISGIVKTWYNNGKLESQRELSRNKKTGTALAWYREGGLMFMEEYEEDRLIKGTYYKKNHHDPVSSIINGNGIATLFDDQGIFLRKVQYLKGKPIDPET